MGPLGHSASDPMLSCHWTAFKDSVQACTADLKSLELKKKEKKVLCSALLSVCVVASIQGFDHVSPLWQNMTGIWRQAFQENAD